MTEDRVFAASVSGDGGDALRDLNGSSNVADNDDDDVVSVATLEDATLSRI